MYRSVYRWTRNHDERIREGFGGAVGAVLGIAAGVSLEYWLGLLVFRVMIP